MKRFVLFLLAFLPISLEAQDYILRAGKEVYKFDETKKIWSEKPLSIGSTLSKRDSIKSMTPFTLEVPLSLWNILSTRVYTYIDYPNGVRLSSNLEEKQDRYTIVSTRVVDQSSVNAEMINHIAWMVQNHSDAPYGPCAKMEFVDMAHKTLIQQGCSVSIDTPASIMILNEENEDIKNDNSIYSYILWKDKQGWKYFWEDTSRCVKILPSCFFKKENFTFSKPFGEQTVFLIASKVMINQDSLERIIKQLNKKNPEARFSERYKSLLGYDIIEFSLTK